MSLFLRLLEDEDKGAVLASALRALAAGEPDREVFALVPGAPFAYWAERGVLRARAENMTARVFFMGARIYSRAIL